MNHCFTVSRFSGGLWPSVPGDFVALLKARLSRRLALIGTTALMLCPPIPAAAGIGDWWDRACSHHVNSQPTALKKFRHSCGLNIWQTSPIAFQTSSKVLAPALLR